MPYLARSSRSSASRIARGEGGFTLPEVLIALGVLATTGVALLSGLSTGAKAHFVAARHSTATALAATQMEYVKSLPFAISYTPAAIPTAYVGYSASIATTALRDGNLQQVTITVERDGTTLRTLSGYKAQ